MKSNSAASNHMRNNAQQIKEQEQLNRERAQHAEFVKEKKDQLVTKQRQQFEHVKSAGYGVADVPQTPNDDVEIKVYVRECEKDAHQYSILESVALKHARPPPQPDRPVRANSGSALKPILHGRRANTNTPPDPKPASVRGEVPQYIQRRKAEMEAEKAAVEAELARQKEQAKYPPGHRPVGEEEKAAILEKLAQRKKELQAELGRIPIRFDTNAIKQRRAQFETELAEVEAAETKFSSKRQLFVPI